MTNPSIPASQLVQVVPSVLGAGGNPLALNSIFLTKNTAVPVGVVQSFSTAQDVADFFGPESAEAIYAAIYFAGYEQATTLPGTLYFYQYEDADVAAYLRGGSLADSTLAAIQALSGTLVIAIDGRVITSASINLSSATSYSNAATLIQAGLRTTGGIFQGTASQTAAQDEVIVSAVASGTLHIGDVLTGTDVDSGLTILTQVDGTPGGIGTYTVSTTTGFTSTTVSVSSGASVSYDSQRQAFKILSATTGVTSTIAFPTISALPTGLKLTSATGAVLSQGAAATTPSATMNAIVALTQNWAVFFTVWEPNLATKLLFADWVTTTTDRYMYVAWDSDVAAEGANASGTFGALTATFDGVLPMWNPDGKIAAFACAITASINFTQTNGRPTYAYRKQAGLVADVTNATIANNLIGNGYNFYASYATANDSFTFLQPGQISGDWNWIDEYVNQISLNAQLQLAFMELLSNTPSIPYNQAGYALLRAAALDPITAAVNFGSIRAGVTLSNAQAAQVNSAAGLKISDTLQQIGWYLQIQDASPQVRANRGSPPMTLWYMSGGSVQKINLASIDIL
jgi:hypothetical protein